MEPMTGIRYIKGVGEKRAQLFSKLGVETLWDLVNFFPRDYEDRTTYKNVRDLSLGERACVCLTIGSVPKNVRIRGGRTLCKLHAFDETGTIDLTFFNRPYLQSQLRLGESYVFFGKVQGNFLKRELINPEFETLGKDGKSTGRILPVYPLTAGLTRNQVMKCMESALKELDGEIYSILPPETYRRYGLIPDKSAYHSVHFPQSLQDGYAARRRFSFEEFFLFCTGLQIMRTRRGRKKGRVLPDISVDPFLKALPFELTGAQKRAIDEIVTDLHSGEVMSRLIQGDVGSGKTMVAACACYLACASGAQAAVMAPTSILARQHDATFRSVLSSLGIRIRLLTGATGKKEKEQILEEIRSGECDLLIGTHALIEKDVLFKDLALVVTDEQHRFGVRQRSLLTEKGQDTHTLYLSATPIPRTLALILYGDLNVSVIDELPPGRKSVKTAVRHRDGREKVFDFVRREAEAGRQIYIVCPLVDENGDEDLHAVETYAEELKEKELKGISVGIMHGRMKNKDKEAVMQAFQDREIRVLVSTTVIEVGVDVPNASVMIIETAERFGLSQLHQLRGRVGRGEHQSYCILFTEHSGDQTAKRLDAMCRTNDGFEIAQTDLEIRGPGDFFGEKQHGLPEFRVADLATDIEILHQAKSESENILREDPELTDPRHATIRTRIRELFSRTTTATP